MNKGMWQFRSSLRETVTFGYMKIKERVKQSFLKKGYVIEGGICSE